MGWRNDRLILDRIQLHRELYRRRELPAVILAACNELQRKAGQPEIAMVTMWRDRAHLKELIAEENAAARVADEDVRQRHLAELDEVVRKAWQAFETAGQGSLNRSAYLNAIKGAIMDAAKLDGTLETAKQFIAMQQVTIDARTVDVSKQTASEVVGLLAEARGLRLGAGPEPAREIVDVEAVEDAGYVEVGGDAGADRGGVGGMGPRLLRDQGADSEEPVRAPRPYSEADDIPGAD